MLSTVLSVMNSKLAFIASKITAGVLKVTGHKKLMKVWL